MDRTRALALILFAVSALAGCSGPAAGVMPSASVTSTMQGWEHWFALEWTAVERPDGRHIDGYIYNNYGAAAGGVRILAQSLDDSGALLGQKIAWVPGEVPALNRSHFTVAGLPPAPQYRVSVWSFDFVQSPSTNMK